MRAAAALIAVALAGCATRPAAPPVPADLARIPDAEPRVEPLRIGGPNKTYEVFGRAYRPLAADVPFGESGLASWYGPGFHGKPTASGEIYDMYAMTAAHRTMPIPSYARVRNPANGREVIVRINDRGPFVEPRVIDLSYAAASRLGVLRGVAPVRVDRLTHDEIRAGWSRPAAPPVVALPADDGDDRLGALLAQRGLVAAPAAGHWLQLGTFAQRESALRLREQLARDADWLAGSIGLFDDQGLTRVDAGPYASRADAEQAAERLRPLFGVLPRVIERR